MTGDPGKSTSNKAGKPESVAEWVVLAIATGLFVGMIPPRVATLATLWGIPLTLLLSSVVGWIPFLLILVVLWVIGIPICGRAAQIIGQDDPREVTYDEFATLPLVYFLAPELTWQVLCAGFVLHRFFDILKPLGIKRLEKLPAGLGIMADDVLASLYALLCMRLLFHFTVL
jgi:phosphatidylglycerophosphatase A